MIVGFRKSPPSPTLTVIKGFVIELVDSYKYVFTIINSKHCFEGNIDAGLFFFFKKYSRDFSFWENESCEHNYDDTLLSEFHWVSPNLLPGSQIANKKRLYSLVRVSSKIIGVSQAQLTNIHHRQVLRKADAISDCSDHPLRGEFEFLPLRWHFRRPGGGGLKDLRHPLSE